MGSALTRRPPLTPVLYKPDVVRSVYVSEEDKVEVPASAAVRRIVLTFPLPLPLPPLLSGTTPGPLSRSQAVALWPQQCSMALRKSDSYDLLEPPNRYVGLSSQLFPAATGREREGPARPNSSPISREVGRADSQVFGAAGRCSGSALHFGARGLQLCKGSARIGVDMP